MDIPTLDDSAAQPIAFAFESVGRPAGFDEAGFAAWLLRVAGRHGREVLALTYVAVTDAALHRLNVDYLGHDTLTDVITFDLGGEGRRVEGECYISLERVRENAATYAVPVLEEFARVAAHGLLHLCGLGDKTPAEQTAMRAAEDAALALRHGDTPPAPITDRRPV